MNDFFTELKRRNVFKVGAAYLILAWLIAQVAELALDSFEAPVWVMKTILLLLALGLLPALLFAWAFEITPEGIKRDKDARDGTSDGARSGRRLSQLIVAAAVLAAGLFLWAERDDGNGPTAQSPPMVVDRSVAVLPFVNMSPDPAQEYFSDGITEEIINAVVKIPGLSVPARTSVFAFRDHRGDVREIGASLGVSHVLEGSVRSQDDQVRITAQLIKVNDGYHLWSETFDRKLENLFAVQEEIAAAIAEVLVGKLGAAVATVPNQTSNMAAYDTYLKGRAALRRREGLEAASFALDFGGAPRVYFAEPLDLLTRQGLLAESPRGDLRLTARGRLLADSVFEHFVCFAVSLRCPSSGSQMAASVAPGSE